MTTSAISLRQRGLALLLGLCMALGAVMQAAPAQAFEVEEIRILPAGSNVVTGSTSVEFSVKFGIWVFSVDPSDFRVGNDPLNANATLSPSIATVTSVRAGSGYPPDYDDLWYVTVSGANLASYTGQLSLALAADHVITEGISFKSENLIPAVREWWDVRSAPPPPPLPAPWLDSFFDSGFSNSDRITKSTTLVVHAGRTTDMTSFELFAERGGNVRSVGMGVVGGGAGVPGTWGTAVQSRTLSDGTWNFFGIATYASGQQRETGRVAITLDRQVEDAVFTFTERGSDGSPTDGITNQRVFDYTLQAEANSQVRLSNFPATQVLSWARQPGPFSFSGAFSLADGPEGEYKINVQTTDAAGNTRTQEVARITLDTVAPTISSVRLAEESDSGYSNSDGVTNEPFPKFSAVFAGGAAQARLILDGAVLTPWTAVAPDGRWTSEQPVDILKGRVRIEARDLAANIATTDYSYRYEPEREIPSNVFAQHSPDNTAEFVTADTIPLFLGSSIPQPFRVRLNRDGAPFSPLISSNGHVDLGPLVDGEQLTAASFVAEDHAGNPLRLSLTPATITVDMTAPDLPVITLLDDDGVSPTDLIFSVANPRLRITAEPGALVRISGGGDVLYFTMPASGPYEARLSGLTAGTHTLAVEIRDPAGNITTGTFGPITFDTDAPTDPSTRIAAASDSGFSNSDGITNVARPTLEARATDAAQGRLTAPYVTGWTDLVGGVWTHAAADDLNGTYTVELRDLAGNTVPVSGYFTHLANDITVTDLRFAGAWKTGTSDTATNLANLTIEVSLSDPSDRPLFVDEGTLTGAPAVTPDAGSFEFAAPRITLTGLGDRTTVDLTALRIVDKAGNVLPPTVTGPQRLTVDLTAPVPPTLELVNDVSVAPGFVYLNTSVPRLRVTALPDPGLWNWDAAVASGVVELTAVGQEFDLPALPDDGYYVLLNATDAAGNDSDDYFFGPFAVDTVPPTLTQALLESGSDSGFDNTDQITNLARPMIYLELGCCTYQARLRKGADVGAWQNVDGNRPPFLTPEFDLNGAYSIDLRDEAGNIASSDHSYTWLPPLADTVENRLTVSHAGTGGDDAWSNLTQVPLTVTNPTGRAFRQVGTGAPPTGFIPDAVVTLALDASPEGAQLRPADLLAFEDEAGNPLAFAATPEMITIDTTAPDIVSARISASDDTGLDSSDQITNVRAPHIEAVINDGVEARIVKGANASDWTVVPPDGRWSADPGFDLDGAYRIEARDRAGNLAQLDGAYTFIPAFGPVVANLRLAPGTDSGTLGDGITMQTDDLLFDWDVTGDPSGRFTATLLEGGRVRGRRDFVSGLGTSMIANGMAEGAYSLTLRITDIAGNSVETTPPFALVVDGTPPVMPGFAFAPGVDDGLADDDRYFSTTQPAFDITVPAGEDMTLAWVSDLSPALRAEIALSAGTTQRHVLNAAVAGTHTVSVTVSDAAGNIVRTTLDPFTIDPDAPVVTDRPRIAAVSDSGASDSDGITNVATPIIEMPLTQAEARYNDGTTFGPWAPADGDGIWRQAVTLGAGAHSLRLEVRNRAGLAGFSATAGARIVTDPPPAPERPDLDAASDTGRAQDDDITRQTTGLRIALAGAHAGIDRRLDLRDGAGRVLGSVAPAGAAPGSVTLDLGEGRHALRAQAVDLAGNTSDLSEALVLVIDATAPAVPTGGLDPAQDTGTPGDGLTASATPALLITHEDGARIDLTLPAGVTLAGRSQPSPGQTRIDLVATIDGALAFAVTATDLAGNISGAGTLGFTLDRIAPVLTLDAPDGVQDRPFSVGLRTSKPVHDLDVADIMVTGGTLTGFAPDGAGWRLTFTPTQDTVQIALAAGAATDAAGNQSGAVAITVAADTDAPVAVISLPAGPYGGPVTGRITPTKPVIGLEAGDLVVLNAGISDFRADGAGFAFVLTPDHSGDIQIDIPQGAFTDHLGKASAATLVSLGGAQGVPAAATRIAALLTRNLVLEVPVVLGDSVTLRARADLAPDEAPVAVLTRDGVPLAQAPEITAGQLTWRLTGLQPGRHDFGLALPETGRHLAAAGSFAAVLVDLFAYLPGSADVPATAFAGDSFTLRLPVGPLAAEGTMARITAGSAQVQVPVTAGMLQADLTMPDTDALAIVLDLPGTAVFAALNDHPVATVTRAAPLATGLRLTAATDGLVAPDMLDWALAFDNPPRGVQATLTVTIDGPDGPVVQTTQVDLDGSTPVQGRLAIAARGSATLSASVPATPRTQAATVALAPFAVAGAPAGLVMTLSDGPYLVGASITVIAEAADPAVAAALA